MEDFFGELRAAVQQVPESPERLDVVLWLLRSAHATVEHVHYAYENLSRVNHGNINLGEMLRWWLDGLPALYTFFESYEVFSASDCEEWWISLAWLVIVSNGDCVAVLDTEHDPNWLCRSQEGDGRWCGLGIKDLHTDIEINGRNVSAFAVNASNGEDDVMEAEYFRVCIFGETPWPGIPERFGFVQEWEDCLPADDDDEWYDDDYE